MSENTTLLRLRCGMALLVIENHEVAVATADIWARTGAADEPSSVAGISHFLEHMLFKGTERYGLGEIERKIESVGGVSNAATSYDYTHYYVTMPAQHLAVAIDMLAEMTRHSTLDADELEKERLVILEEYRRKQDYPLGVLYERLYAELFEAGPYHESVIGREETIRSIDRAQMLDYYHRRYAPESLALVVTGDVDADEVRQLAEKAFVGFDRPLEALRPAEVTRYGAAKRIHLEKPTGGEVYVAFAFPAPGMNQAEKVLPLDMAQFILGQGRASILYQQIKEKRGLCSSISTYYGSQRGDSLFVVLASCLPSQRGPLREVLLEELRKFASVAPTVADFERARRLLASAHRFSMETSGGAAVNAGYYYTLTGSTEFLDRYMDRLEATTPQTVLENAQEILPAGAPETKMVEVAVGPDGQSAS